MICEANGIEHRLTKPNHPWTNGQAERMNCTIKDATTKRYHYDGHEQRRTHFELFLDAYNHARRLRPSRGSHPPSSSGRNGSPGANSSTKSRAT